MDGGASDNYVMDDILTVGTKNSNCSKALTTIDFQPYSTIFNAPVGQVFAHIPQAEHLSGV